MKQQNYLETCCGELEMFNEAPTDQQLTYFLQLTKLQSEVVSTLGYYDTDEPIALGPERIHLTVRDFVARLQALRRSFSPVTSQNRMHPVENLNSGH